MKAHEAFAMSALKTFVGIMILLIPLAGCDDDLVSPCVDCSQDGRFTEVTERNFAADGVAVVSVENFVGKVTYRTGESGNIRVRATKRAEHQSDLDFIELEMTERPGELDIRTHNPENLKRASVHLEIIVPTGTRPQISTGVGDIDYQGRPVGACRFTAGVGSVRLRLRADARITVDLTTGVGSIFLDFHVEGSIRKGSVVGRIGNGNEATVYVSTGVGAIHLTHP